MSLPDWEPDSWVAVGTISLAVVTLLLAAATTAQARLSRRVLQASLRPLLVDVPVSDDGEPFAVSDENGVTEIEVTLRNGGTGFGTHRRGAKADLE
jgi:hypothetical protein